MSFIYSYYLLTSLKILVIEPDVQVTVHHEKLL